MSRRIRVIDSDSEHSGVEDNDDIVRAHENENSLSENENQSGSEHSEREDTNLENQNVDNDGTETKDDKNDEDGEKKPVKKRTGVKRVVLNTERLKGPKGVHTIEKLYEGFKFKGKGHEQEDLNRVMKRLEYWAYRVFPRLSFDDFIEKLEQLGHKKDLQAHIKKYRLGMISADEFVGTEENIEEEERNDEPEIATRQNELLEQIQNENFDALLNEPFFNN